MMFRLVARVFFEREEERRKLPAEISNCPTECPNAPKYYDPRRSKQCVDCPHRIEKENFKLQAEDTIFEIMGKRKFDFDKILNVFYQIRSLEDVANQKYSVKSGIFLGVYFQEKNRAEKLRESRK